ncbi:MAG: DUF3343 domain-containing protein [Christensenellaceae bacterium]|nr:DUF3343 domain-containing protein [Christensenellaceae bacterium]
MSGQDVRYYILFEDYTHGMALHELMLADGVPHRIVPAPRSLQGEVSCGMALLVNPEDIEAARACIERHQAVHHSIAALEGQIKPRRDRYC